MCTNVTQSLLVCSSCGVINHYAQDIQPICAILFGMQYMEMNESL